MVGRILNYGSVNVDEFFSVPHICQSGETLSSTEYFVRAGGKGKKEKKCDIRDFKHEVKETECLLSLGANQSVAFAKAGGKVFHAGNFGHDAAWIREYMSENGVDMTYANIKEDEVNKRDLEVNTWKLTQYV